MEFIESGLLFKFDDTVWTVVFQFDKHTDYKKLCNVVPGTKAIDFLAISSDNAKLILMEIKSFRKHRLDIATQTRMANGAEDLTTEFAQKVRDSIAAMVGGARNSTHHSDLWQNIVTILLNPRRDVFVIPWIEEESISAFRAKLRKNKASIHIDVLKNKLKWLTPHVNISNVKDSTFHLNGLTVSFLPENNP